MPAVLPLLRRQPPSGARSVNVHPDAMAAIARIRKLGYANLPICIAKTQYSLSDDPRLRGRQAAPGT